MKYEEKIVSVLLTAAMATTMLAGCGGNSNTKSDANANSDAAEGSTTADAGSSDAGSSDGEEITLKVFSNLPDRKNGQGLVEQTIIQEYMNENPNVKIEVEALDEEAYKTKFRAYSMEGLPDIVSIWGQPAFLDEVLDAGVLAELNEDDYADYGFVSGSLEGFKKDGKLYGLPRNTDVAGFYYNQKMFEDNGWKVPTTSDELLELAGTIQNAGLFQNGYDSQDYATAQNLFINGQAAMYYMGSWDASMALNEDIEQDIRMNIRVFTMPVVDGGKGTATDIAAWNGGGYGVSESSEHKDEAIKFLNYMYQPDKLSKYGWQNGVGMSAQDQTAYMTGDETELQMQFVDAVNNATSVSGTPINDCGPSAFKTSIESEIQSVSNGSMSVDDFLAAIGSACQ